MDNNQSMWNFNELSKYYVWVIPPYGKSQKNEKWQIKCFDEWWKYFFHGALST